MMAEKQRAGTHTGAKKAPAQGKWTQLGAAFWEGLSEPSTLALRMFLVTLSATCAFCFWFFSEATLAGSMGRYLPRSDLDAEGFATHEALRSGRTVPDRPRLFVLGTSTVAQAIGSGSIVQDRIRAVTGQDWEVVILTTPLQSPTDQFALLDRALESQTNDSPPVIVAMGFGLQRLRWDREQTLEFAAMPRLGLRSDWADAEILALGGTPAARTGFYLWDNRAFVLINGSEALIRLVTFRPAKRRIAQYAVGPEHAPRPEIREKLGDEIRTAASDSQAYFAQIDRLAANMASVPNSKLVLIDELLSPAVIADQKLENLRAKLDAALAAFIEERDLSYWPLGTEAGLTSDDYFDDLHIRPGDAQSKVQDMLANHIVAEITAGIEGDDGG